jgi:hypothetical protein
MTKTNKVTTLRVSQQLTDEQIQAHLDSLNADGYYLVAVDNLVGWYRLFWEKEIE